MKIKKGDKVQILKGKDKGKTGPIVKVLRDKSKVIIEGVNQLTKHQRPKKEGEKGTKVTFSAPIDIAKVMLVCPKCGKATRVGFVFNEGKKKMRMCKKCKGTF